METSEVKPLSLKDLHFIDLHDIPTIKFPTFIQNKIRELAEKDVLSSIEIANKEINEAKQNKADLHSLSDPLVSALTNSSNFLLNMFPWAN
eukprot:CAMPEP_0174265726 /NCGR_PEP_ID=MMETSP0439-20130205/27639_1 /TAXON_ID=0 /ORGANISM="Stereomyxa ramosa, Strain Chinc5" /LENGTH=90 /DNA_ID=CAMNT_0015352325 /DNA_START=188 /DNA_END=457 /DNA_ORIENTATION=+